MFNILTRYRKKVQLYNERVEDLNSVTQQRDEIKKQYDEWRKRRLSLLLYIFSYFILIVHLLCTGQLSDTIFTLVSG